MQSGKENNKSSKFEHMKKNLLLVVFLMGYSSANSFAQDGIQIGVEVAPSWVLNTHRNLSTGVRSSESGYGFNIGVPVRFGVSESMTCTTGLNYEYIAFDNRVNNTLISSNRFNGINLPLGLSYGLSGNWNVNGGVGLKYLFMTRAWSGFAVDISNSVNQFQPYVTAGVSTQSEVSIGTVEYGLNARFHPINVWESSAPQAANNTSKIVAFDLSIKFFLFSL